MVSVIIPSYNREDTIERSVRSVLAQTYSDLEVIVVDDCSTDNTENVVRAIDDNRVRYHCLEKNSGACVARNKGISLAKGDIIAFQDSDDEWRPNKLERQLAVMEKTNADVCFCKMKRYNPENIAVSDFPNDLQEGFIPYKVLYSFSHVSTQTIVAKREVCEKHKFDLKVKKGQDFDWVLRAGAEYKFYYVDEILVTQYGQNESVSVSDGLNKSLAMHIYFVKKYRRQCIEQPDFHVALLNQVANIKVKMGKNATSEYRKIYQIKKTKRNLAKYVLSKLHLIGTYYRLFR